MKGTLIKTTSGYNLWLNPKTKEQEHIAADFLILDINGTDIRKYKLSKQNCDEIFGIVDVEKLAEEEIPYSSSTTLNVQRMRFIHGFNKAIELNKDKLFTVADMHDAVMLGVCFENPGIRGISNYNEAKDLAIKRALEQKEIDVEVIIDKIPADLAPGGWDVFPKLDEEGCLILKRIG
jgi:hypothetical protein